MVVEDTLQGDALALGREILRPYNVAQFAIGVLPYQELPQCLIRLRSIRSMQAHVSRPGSRDHEDHIGS